MKELLNTNTPTHQHLGTITVFCGSSIGSDEIYKEQAALLGQTLVKHNLNLVYGGAKIGLMGVVADAVLKEGGKVFGVLPDFLSSKEIAHENLTELFIVNSMHERKVKMDSLSDGVIALPGGFGTLEELFEILTWGQLGLHTKPIGILNVNGFYNELLNLLQTMVDKGFLKELNQKMLLVSDDAEILIHQMKNYQAAPVLKWIERDGV